MLKLIAWAFFFMSLTAIPAILMNLFNSKSAISADTLLLSTSTLAGLAATGAGSPYVPYTFPNPLGGRDFVVSRSLVAIIYVFCDLGAVGVFFFCYRWLLYFTRHEERQVDRATVTASDFTVFLPVVPRDTTELDLKELFERVTVKQPELPSGAKVADAFVVEKETYFLSEYVKLGDYRRLIERLDVRLAHVLTRINAGDTGAGFETLLGGLPGAQRRLERVREKLAKKYEALSAKAKRVASGGGGAVAAFVTFERAPVAGYVVNFYAASSVAGWLCCQPKHLRLKGAPVHVHPAPLPAAVLWGNLAITPCSRAARQSATGVLAFVLLVASFLALWVAASQHEILTEKGVVADCSAEPYASRLRAGSTSPLNATAAARERGSSLYCFCGSLPWASLSVADVTASTLPSAAPVRGSDCPAWACPAIFSRAPSTAVGTEWCTTWVTDSAYQAVLVVAASVAVNFINDMLKVFMRIFTAVEGHLSFDDLNASLAHRLFLAQFFNTAVLSILINIAWTGTQPPGQGLFRAGEFPDLVTAWYLSVGVGVGLLITMLVNVVTPHIDPLIAAAKYWYTVSRKEHPDVLTQSDLNELFVGPHMDWAVRYAELATWVCICFIFSTGIPALLPTGALVLFAYYWVDKVLFLYFYRRPPAFGSSLQKAFVAIMPAAMLLHLAWDAWTVSWGNVLFWGAGGKGDYDPGDVNKWRGDRHNDMVRSGTAPALIDAFDRLSQIQVLPLAFAWLILFLWRSGSCCARSMSSAGQCLTCGRLSCGRLSCGRLSCGRCRAAGGDVEFKVDGDEVTYADACSPANAGTAKGIVGIASYNVLLQPEVIKLFGITREFAAKHRRLADVATFALDGAVGAPDARKDAERGSEPGDEPSPPEALAVAVGGGGGGAGAGADAAARAPPPPAAVEVTVQPALPPHRPDAAVALPVLVELTPSGPPPPGPPPGAPPGAPPSPLPPGPPPAPLPVATAPAAKAEASAAASTAAATVPTLPHEADAAAVSTATAAASAGGGASTPQDDGSESARRRRAPSSR